MPSAFHWRWAQATIQDRAGGECVRRPTERTTRPMSRVVAHGSRRIELGVHTLPACSDGRGRSIHHCMIDGLARCAALAVVRLPRIATGGTARAIARACAGGRHTRIRAPPAAASGLEAVPGGCGDPALQARPSLQPPSPGLLPAEDPANVEPRDTVIL